MILLDGIDHMTLVKEEEQKGDSPQVNQESEGDDSDNDDESPDKKPPAEEVKEEELLPSVYNC